MTTTKTMSRKKIRPASALRLVAAFALAQPLGVLAQATTTASVSGDASGAVAGERLSEWLLRSPLPASELAMGLRWRVPAEVEAQQALKSRILDELAEKNQTANTAQLGALISALPLTGRVPLPSTNPRWLQANGAQDPVIEGGEAIERSARASPRPAAVPTRPSKRCSEIRIPNITPPERGSAISA